VNDIVILKAVAEHEVEFVASGFGQAGDLAARCAPVLVLELALGFLNLDFGQLEGLGSGLLG